MGLLAEGFTIEIIELAECIAVIQRVKDLQPLAATRIHEQHPAREIFGPLDARLGDGELPATHLAAGFQIQDACKALAIPVNQARIGGDLASLAPMRDPRSIPSVWFVESPKE